MAKKEKLDQIEEMLRAVEEGEDYAFADMEDLCLVPDMAIPPACIVVYKACIYCISR